MTITQQDMDFAAANNAVVARVAKLETEAAEMLTLVGTMSNNIVTVTGIIGRLQNTVEALLRSKAVP